MIIRIQNFIAEMYFMSFLQLNSYHVMKKLINLFCNLVKVHNYQDNILNRYVCTMYINTNVERKKKFQKETNNRKYISSSFIDPVNYRRRLRLF